MSVESLERLAAGQYGLFTAAQATKHVSRQLLSYHSSAGGRWRRRFPAVYELCRTPPDWRRPLMAALVWAGPEAVLCRRSAGAALGLDGCRGGPVHLWSPRSTKAPPGIVTHHGMPPPPSAEVGLLRCTVPLVTLIALAAELEDDEWEWALESALRNRQVDLAELERAAATGRARRRIRRVLAKRPPDASPTGSIRETQFIQLARTVDVDPFVRQYPVMRAGRIEASLDLAWPHLGVFIEIDGHWHDSDGPSRYDRNRQTEVVTELGWRPLRYDSDDILRRPRYTAKRLARAFRRARSGTWGQPPHVAVPPGA